MERSLVSAVEVNVELCLAECRGRHHASMSIPILLSIEGRSSRVIEFVNVYVSVEGYIGPGPDSEMMTKGSLVRAKSCSHSVLEDVLSSRR